MNILLIKMFNAALVEGQPTISEFKTVNTKALQLGYLVPQEICNASVLAFLTEQNINPNATFYKTFEDVTSKSRLELLFDQVLHYLTTYGTGFEVGNGYVPNNGEIPVIPFETYKVISVITPEELFDKCYDMLCSGIALKQTTMEALADYVIDFFRANPKDCIIDIDSIKNKEAQIYICDKLDMYPNNANSLLRYIIFKTTGSTMLIKDKATIDKIKNSNTVFDFNKLSEKQLVALSSIFLRFKNLFLAFKHKNMYDNKAYKNVTVRSNNAVAINKLRRLAVKNHKPMQEGFWQNVFKNHYTAQELRNEVENLTNYKKVALMQSCIDRSAALDNQFYLIRNQRAFLREGYKPASDTAYNALVYTVLRNSLVESLKKNAITTELIDLYDENGVQQTAERPKVIKMNSDVEIALPTSEKSFIGNYPFGTAYPLTKNNYIGIYWKNEWGTRDFDLSLINYNGQKIGWNSDYYDDEQNIIFSGDMTNAEPEAAEVMLIKKTAEDLKAVIKVNQFSGRMPSKYKFYFAQNDNGKIHTNYMVNPNDIKLETEVPVEDKKEQTIGLICGGKAILMAINTGNLYVSCLNKHITNMMDAIEHKAKCFVMAKDILADAGYIIVDETYNGKVDLDFTQMQKDSLISLMK